MIWTIYYEDVSSPILIFIAIASNVITGLSPLNLK